MTTRRRIKRIVWISVAAIVLIIFLVLNRTLNATPFCAVGDRLDSLNGVVVYYNGGAGNVSGRNVTEDGYNLGLKYQCVEFVKRYYFQHFNHKMPDTYGNAKDFFDAAVGDGRLNAQRGLLQFTNESSSCPRVGDLVVFDGSTFNEYGHVAIVSEVAEDEVEIIQQNSGAFGRTRKWLDLEQVEGRWRIDDDRLLGWLRKE